MADFPPVSKVYVGAGELGGKGVYANREIKAEEVVIIYKLVNLSEDEYRNLPDSEKLFTHIHGGTIVLYGEPERYVNHSDNPNTYQDHMRRCDVALRDISKDEMITTDAKKDDF